MNDRGNDPRTQNRERKRRHKRRVKALEAVTYLALIGMGCSHARAVELAGWLVEENLKRLQKVVGMLTSWDYFAMKFAV